MLRYFWKHFCEVFDFLSVTHSRGSWTYSLVSGEKWLICLIFAVCLSTSTFIFFSWEDQDPLKVFALIHPISLLPSSPTPIFSWHRLVFSISSPLICLFFFFSSSVCLIFVFPCDSFNPWFPVLCLPILPLFLQSFFFSPHLSMMFPFSLNEILLWLFSLSHSRLLTLWRINNDNNNDNFISFFFLLLLLYLVWTPPLPILTLVPSLTEWPLSCDLLFPLPLLFSFPSLYLARRTSFPPWVQQTPVWKLKVEGEALEER